MIARRGAQAARRLPGDGASAAGRLLVCGGSAAQRLLLRGPAGEGGAQRGDLFLQRGAELVRRDDSAFRSAAP